MPGECRRGPGADTETPYKNTGPRIIAAQINNTGPRIIAAQINNTGPRIIAAQINTEPTNPKARRFSKVNLLAERSSVKRTPGRKTALCE